MRAENVCDPLYDTSSDTVHTLVFLRMPSLWILAFFPLSGPTALDREVRPFKLKQPFPCRKPAEAAPPRGGPCPQAPGGAVQSGQAQWELTAPFAGCRTPPAPHTQATSALLAPPPSQSKNTELGEKNAALTVTAAHLRRGEALHKQPRLRTQRPGWEASGGRSLQKGPGNRQGVLGEQQGACRHHRPHL